MKELKDIILEKPEINEKLIDPNLYPVILSGS